MNYNPSLLIELGEYKIHYGFLGESTPLGSFVCKVLNAYEVYTDNCTELSKYYAVLYDFWDSIFFRHFIVKQKDKVVYLVRPPFVCNRFMDLSLELLFNSYGVAEVHFQPSCLLPLLPLGHSFGIVIDINPNSIFIYSTQFGCCDIFRSVYLKRDSLKTPQTDDEESRTIIESILTILKSIPIAHRKAVISNILIYDHETSSVDLMKFDSISSLLCQKIESTPSHACLLSAIPLIKQSKPTVNEYLYWKGYCVCTICKIKDESWTLHEWKEGKRWKDPLEIKQ